MNLRKGLLTTTLAVGCSLVLAYFLALVLLVLWCPPQMDEWFRPRSRKPFSEPAWRSTSFGDPDRYRLANDLVRSGLLLSRTQEEVRLLLGKPTLEGVVGSELRLGYELTPQRQFPAGCVLLPRSLFINADTWALELRFVNGRVTIARIRYT
jgi:hypothetical protein